MRMRLCICRRCLSCTCARVYVRARDVLTIAVVCFIVGVMELVDPSQDEEFWNE